ncbi:hypothetical protein BIFBIF_01860 [Bifidobacterium bifidum ATCC 29521 = JCM 1255 = DSM 20456]|nr:hypothetical protein BIFBIF_01860 [Bifidobacterium bifidum ATCC 29521 = JCM 1255 = DSM 20456]
MSSCVSFPIRICEEWPVLANSNITSGTEQNTAPIANMDAVHDGI